MARLDTIQIGPLNISTRRTLRKADTKDAVVKAFLDSRERSIEKSINYIAQRFSLQQYRFRNYTADEQVYKGYIESSLGSACVARYEVAYPEPDKKIFRDKKEVSIPGLEQLLRTPNPWMTETDFDRFTVKNQLLTGNCYWIKIDKNGEFATGKPVVGLFPFNDMNITPVGMPGNFIDYYKFITFDGEYTEVDPRSVIHMPWLYINPLYTNRGISPAALAASDVDTDTLFGRHVASFVANNGTPNGIITVSKDAVAGSMGISETTAKKLKSSWRERFAGRGQGDIAIMEPGFEYQQIGSNLKDLDLQYARATPEARTCALYLIPPEMVGVNVGLSHSTENNMAESRIRWVNSTLIPLWIQNGKKLSQGLQREYPGVDIKYATNEVQAVKEQRQKWLSNNAAQLLQWCQGYSDGTLNPAVAREGARYSFGLSEEELNAIFPKLPPRSNTSVTNEGDLETALQNENE